MEKRIPTLDEFVNEGKNPPTDATIKQYINQYSVADDPFEVAKELGEKFGWSEKKLKRLNLLYERNTLNKKIQK
jgi:hypothetical protein